MADEKVDTSTPEAEELSTRMNQRLPELPNYPRVGVVGEVNRELEVSTSEDEGAIVITVASSTQAAAVGLTAEESADVREMLAIAEKRLAGLTPLEPGQIWELEIEGEKRQFRVTDITEGSGPVEFELARHDGPAIAQEGRARTTEHPEAHGGVLIGIGPP